MEQIKESMRTGDSFIPHACSVDNILMTFGVEPETGLDSGTVIERRVQYGFNELVGVPPIPPFLKFLEQFNSLVVWILIIAALVSGAMGEWIETIAILAIVLLNAVLGYLQEAKSERALAALRRLAGPTARVIRQRRTAIIAARELVPGDIVEVEAGDNVPADIRLLNFSAISVQEASLTGESAPVAKEAAMLLEKSTPLADRQNILYMGTMLTQGQGRGVVIAIGMQTEIGRIAGLMEKWDREATPLQHRLAELGRVLVVVCLALVGLIFGLGIWHGIPLMQALLSSISLAVAAVPEGLPAVVSMTLALGVKRMVRRQALIRKLPSVETLGCVSVICSDKTGTLTRNEMTVREVLAGGSHFRVNGAGYAPQGEIVRVYSSDRVSGASNRDDDLLLALRIAAYCNHAEIRLDDSTDTWQVVGDPTEGALAVFAMKGGLAAREQKPHIIQELPFDSRRKVMSVLLNGESGGRIQYTKGAPEVVLDRCISERRNSEVVPLSSDRRRELDQENAALAVQALRVLALAYREDDGAEVRIREDGLTFVGLVGIMDPPREEAKQAVLRCREAGIQPVMITGDHPATASAIARELGITGDSSCLVTGPELEIMTDEQLAARVEEIAVYARVVPEHKLRVVRAWKSRGRIVAMTGDGINDAPAVKAADIGIVMGLSGTDVTREASSMVLMDDNFSSIVNAVEEGRAVYDNIQKFLIYLLSCNAGELLLMLLASVFGWPVPLEPVQLLWINFITDGLPALALAMEPPERGIMQRRPRPSHESILNWKLGATCMFQGAILAVVGLTAFALFGGENLEYLDRARTATFCVLVYGELFRSLAARSRQWTFWQLGPFTNPYLFGAVAISALLQAAAIATPSLRPIFSAVTLSGREWGVILALAVTPMTVIELTKFAIQRMTRKLENSQQ